MTSTRRADARRNRERILAVAVQEVAAHGADASLEQIARTVGVGSATVRRHFPTRYALLQAVFRERVELLCARAGELDEQEADPRTALLTWLDEVVGYVVAARGMAVALAEARDDPADDPEDCATRLAEAAGPLFTRARRAGALTPDATASSVLTLVAGVALATEGNLAAEVEARRLFRLVVDGISPRDPGDAEMHA